MNRQGRLRVITLEEASDTSEELVSLCTSDTNLAVVARCRSVDELRKAVLDGEPDLLLLDTEACAYAERARQKSFASVRRLLRAQLPPLAIVITPSMRLAAAAFEIGAVDYLIKPVEERRFHRAIARARERMSEIKALRLYRGSVQGEWPHAVSASMPMPRHQVTIKSDRRVRFVTADDIQSIVSFRNNVVVHTARESHVFRSTLKDIEDRLLGQSFLRVERSIVLNLSKVREVQRLPRQRFLFRMQDGRTHESGALYCARILEYLQECQPFVDLARARASGRRSRAKSGDRMSVVHLGQGASRSVLTPRRTAR